MWRYVCLVCALVLTGCSNQSHFIDRGDFIVDPRNIKEPWLSKPNDYLVFHYTALNDEASLRVLTAGGVSVQYLVPTIPVQRDGKPVVIQLIPEGSEAWHAGKSYWRGDTSLNKNSIGVEIVNLGVEKLSVGQRWLPYQTGQIDLVVKLAQDVIERHNIRPENVVGHSDIAPQRKLDPGPMFPWEYLAKRGIGAWPETRDVQRFLAGRHPSDKINVRELQQALKQYGYEITVTGKMDGKTRNVIKAFQMHFRSNKVNGAADADTLARVRALVYRYGSK
ncbi:MAG TPA: N-acetylmuramoyl-L-alanine amidase [Morganella sp. (in: Bacteria)]|nr:N-acetylmuramoyl-L-alanine amidase [Morganella sp. (in: enterobacteria)]